MREVAGKAADFVLVHGSNHGGWCWDRVVPLLGEAGFKAHAPTLKGLAERADELTPEVGLPDHVDDVASLIEREDLTDVILVCHSAAGAVIPGVAERCEKRISGLVYLDAFVARDGESVMDVEPPESRDYFLTVAREQGDGWRIPAAEAALERWGITDPNDRQWVLGHLTDMPLKAATDPVDAPGGAAMRIPRTFIELTDPRNPGLAPSLERAREEGMRVMSIATGHDAMVSAPDQLAEALITIATGPSPA